VDHHVISSVLINITEVSRTLREEGRLELRVVQKLIGV
jgi:hypothetical protein